jgi:hypothetical protein
MKMTRSVLETSEYQNGIKAINFALKEEEKKRGN